MRKYELRPIGTQYTDITPPSEQPLTSDYDGCWIADTWEVTGYKEVAPNRLLPFTTTGEAGKLVKTQKIRRDIQYCNCCGSLLE